MLQELKSLLRDERLFTVGLLCVVAVVAFLLGQLSQTTTTTAVTAEQVATAGVVFTDTPERAAETPTQAVAVVASRSGTKYHLPTCSGAQTIKKANQIWFASIGQARAAGYQPAGNCPALQ